MSAPMIYGKIAEAMKRIGAIGKDAVAKDKSGKEQYKFRGIDAVYNALNPVMAELGLFICPKIIDQTREERTTQSGGVLKYSVLTMEYTVFAQDGSSITCSVVGEGMDSGDKASNKAMSVAMKYAMFQLFMIPTEDLVDPDAEVHTDVLPKKQPKPDKPATVEQAHTLPKQAQTGNPVLVYLANERKNLQAARQIPEAENAALFKKQTEILKDAGIIPDKALSAYTMQEAEHLIQFMYTRFKPTGTELLPDDGKTA